MSDKPRAAFLDFIKPYTDQSVVGIPRALVMLMHGDWTAAAMFNQILYWCGISNDPENWFYKTNEDWQNELCLTTNQLKRYKTMLAEFGVETKLKKANGVPTTHYRVNEDKLQEAATPILAKLQNGGIRAIAGYPQMARTGSKPPRRKPSNRNRAIAHDPLTETTSETNQQRLQNTGDRASAKTPPLQTEGDHVNNLSKMVKPEPRKELLYAPTAQPSKPESNAPLSVPAVFPINAMIEALAAACMKFVKLGAHYVALRETADQLISLGFTADDVTQWRAKCWPDHWKAKKDQPIPTLKDVVDNIGQVRTLPTTPITTNPHEATAALYDDRPNPYAKDDALPPRNIEYLEEYDPRFDKWNAAKDAIAITNPKIDGWLRKFRPIGIDADGAIVIEVATDETKAKFEQYKTLLLATMNIKPRGNHKPDAALVCVVVGDEQYRLGGFNGSN